MVMSWLLITMTEDFADAENLEPGKGQTQTP